MRAAVSRWFWMAAAPMVLVACVEETRLPDDEDTTGLEDEAMPEDDAGRCDFATSELALDDTATLGFAVQSVVDAVTFEQHTQLSWDLTDEITDLTVIITPDSGPAALHVGTWIPPEGGDDIAAQDCGSYADFGATVRFTTADGRLDETWTVRIAANAEGVGRLDHVVDAETLVGTGPVFEGESTEWDSLELDIAANLSSGVSQGELAVSGFRQTSPQTDDPDEPVTAEGFSGDVARWPAVGP